jgi:hypothetical protein
MPTYHVVIKEVHESHRQVEADSAEEALEEAGGATETYCEYSRTLDPDTWTVEGPFDEDGNLIGDDEKPQKPSLKVVS